MDANTVLMASTAITTGGLLAVKLLDMRQARIIALEQRRQAEAARLSPPRHELLDEVQALWVQAAEKRKRIEHLEAALEEAERRHEDCEKRTAALEREMAALSAHVNGKEMK